MATFNSTIQGSNTGDTLIGTQANQLIVGGTSADSIGSRFSLSCLVGSGGNDTFFANSVVQGLGVGSTVTGNEGSDSFDFGTYGLTSAYVFGNTENDTIRLTGQLLASGVYGGQNEDSIQLRSTVSGSTVLGNSGSDTIDITAPVLASFIHGGVANDRISVTGSVSGSTVSGGSGADLLSFATGVASSQIDGGLGTENDTIQFAVGVTSSTITFADGNDTLAVGGGLTNSTVSGGSGADSLGVSLR
ncbi:MAG: hypothetical protein VKM98_05410, partial [Cyanobacteriota bacterium]|nr:hypothetical protein [Cyanobacteriota bacterium]